MLGGNVALASLLAAARWVESGHFSLSNMYESLLFLAWGITGVHLVVTERDGFSKSAVPGALSAPTALSTVAAATLALPAELQRASALVPALKSNWLMMHVSVMMLSYATLLVGSLSCMSFLVVDASQGWTGAKGALGFVEGMVTKDASAGATAEAAAAASRRLPRTWRRRCVSVTVLRLAARAAARARLRWSSRSSRRWRREIAF